MSAAAVASEHFRGVLCRRCGKPVRVPEMVSKRESASHLPHDSEDTQYHLVSRVFVLRCRACQKESIYAINQIVDCAFTQVSAASGTKSASL
jgi:hypothetical protein